MAIMRTSQVGNVATASAKFATAMLVGARYYFCASTDCWVKVSTTGDSAADAANNLVYVKGQQLILTGGPVAANNFVHFKRITADGECSLALIERE